MALGCLKHNIPPAAISALAGMCCLLALAAVPGCLPSGGCADVVVPPTLFYLRGGPVLDLTASGIDPAAAQSVASAVAVHATSDIAWHQTSCWSEADNMRLSSRGLGERSAAWPGYWQDSEGLGTTPGALVAAGDDSRIELDPLPDTADATGLTLSGRFSLARAQRGLFELAPGTPTVYAPPERGYTLLRVDWTLTGISAGGPFSVTYAQAMQWRSTAQPHDQLLADLSALPPGRHREQ
jgi:hypothetical protein